ncbi:hypothetical protein FQA39_LY14936 [Lamprigera yunnana]|nr:hypothetical protein FQA39_LY14936 [Lamprigera yunnana]
MVCSFVIFFAVFLISDVSTVPHHHLHKTIYIGADGGGVADANAEGHLSVSASLSGGAATGAEATVSDVKAKKTVIERTVIPQYVEKTIRIPSYVEKTIRVPTLVEKKVKVPVEPAIIEKTISHEHVPVDADKSILLQKETSIGGSRYGRVRGGIGGDEYYIHSGAHGEGFFDRIFNIPIQTLGAVNGLLNGLTGGGHISAGISKGFTTY